VFAAGDEVLVVASEGSESQVRELLVGEDEDDDEPEAGEPDEPEPDEDATEPEPAERLP
jgi:hypothetical protein